MKRTAIMVLALAALAACNGVSVPKDEATVGNIFFEFGAVTKAALVTEDGRIATAQVAVYDGERQIGYVSGEVNAEGGSLELPGMPLNKALDCHAVCNISESLKGMTRSELKAREVDLRKFGPALIPMCASGVKTFTGTDNILEMDLVRIASKVELLKVTPAFESDRIAKADMVLKEIYLDAAPGHCTLSLGSPTAQVRYHQGGYSLDDETALGDAASLVGDRNLDFNLKDRTVYPTGHDFYCCPDDAAKTSLALTVLYQGKDYTFKVALPQLKPNTKYLIKELVLKLPDLPEPPEETIPLDADIKVLDWSPGVSQEVIY